MTIPIAKPVFGPEEARAIQQPLKTGWIVQGPFVKKFEERFAAFIGAPYAAATSSCTTALHIAMAALTVKPGDEVIVPAFTWVATPNVVEYMGARPTFCDIDLRTFNINVSNVQPLITPRTVGLLPVHLFGLCADMEPLLKIARKHHLWIVEDAACAFGARYHGKHAGLFGDMGCFSFHPRKSITTGEGGMITTNRAGWDRLARSLRDHGASKSDLARHRSRAGFLLADYDQLGYNFRMTDMQGALGCVQMDRAAWILEKKSKLAKRYEKELAGLPWLQLPSVPAGYAHGYQAYVCLFGPPDIADRNVKTFGEKRNRVMARLEEEGIATRQGTHAPVLLGYYRRKYGYSARRFPNAARADRLSLALPLYPEMTQSDQARVCDRLRKAYDAVR